jgi:hypothetical protein
MVGSQHEKAALEEVRATVSTYHEAIEGIWEEMKAEMDAGWEEMRAYQEATKFCLQKTETMIKSGQEQMRGEIKNGLE